MVQGSPYGAVELENNVGKRFKVNRQRVKLYLGNNEEIRGFKLVYLNKA